MKALADHIFGSRRVSVCVAVFCIAVCAMACSFGLPGTSKAYASSGDNPLAAHPGILSAPSASAGNQKTDNAADGATGGGAAEAGLVSIDDLQFVFSYPMPVIPNPTTEAFIDSICEQARQIGHKRNLYASVMIAQAILESGSGSSSLSKPPYNNLFGIKGSYKGAAVLLPTQEDDGSGRLYDIVSAFRKYPSTRESLEDYADLLTESMGSFYAPAWKSNAKTYVEACNYLQGHYATSTTYSSSLQGLILAYHLEQNDHPATAKGKQKANGEHFKSLVALSASQVSTPVLLYEEAIEEAGTLSDEAAADKERIESAVSFAKSPITRAVSFGICPAIVAAVFLLRRSGAFAALAHLNSIPGKR